jgi:hypothetical protein
MAHPFELKEKAIELRKQGYSLKEISKEVGVVKSTSAIWVHDVELDESKFHPCIHIHTYHSAEAQLDFWSKITTINIRQFIKPFEKAHTGKRTREGYQGCISIYYHSADTARRLLALGKAMLAEHGGIVSTAKHSSPKGLI